MLFQKIHISPRRFFSLNPYPSRKFQFISMLSFSNLSICHLPLLQKFQWLSMGWVWIFFWNYAFQKTLSVHCSNWPINLLRDYWFDSDRVCDWWKTDFEVLFQTLQFNWILVHQRKNPWTRVNSSVSLMHHDLSDLGLICVEKKCKIHSESKTKTPLVTY